jgi:hypothetical protein
MEEAEVICTRTSKIKEAYFQECIWVRAMFFSQTWNPIRRASRIMVNFSFWRRFFSSAGHKWQKLHSTPFEHPLL